MSINQNNSLIFSKIAFELAKINLGSTGPNPSVGCVIEKNGSVLSSGHTSLKGRPHAEFNALKKNINFKNSNMYVSLEPCSHYGVTPPCTLNIIKKGIKKVYFSIKDYDIRSKGNAKKIFLKKKIITRSGKLESFAKLFYKSYYLKKKGELPLIDFKIAISKDYYTKSSHSKYITNEHSRKRVHLLRTYYDCILSTSKTINDDNSFLNCRINGLENKSPNIVIIDRKLKIKKNLNLFKNKKQKKILFTSTSNLEKERYLISKGVKIIFIKKMNNMNDYKELFKKLNKMGFSRIFVESGVTFFEFLYKFNFINTLYIFKSQKKLNSSRKYLFKKNIIRKNNYKKIKVNLFKDCLYRIDIK